MSGGYRVSLEDLQDSVDRMGTFQQAIAEALEQVDNQIGRLHTTWVGAAAGEQQAVHARWQAGAREMHQALLTMRSIADNAHSNYTSAVRANTQMWAL